MSDISGKKMERITIRLPRQQADMLEKLVEAGEFPTVSEAVRYAVRELIQKHANQILKERETVSLNV
jgi:antitoxin ParD1/3/4